MIHKIIIILFFFSYSLLGQTQFGLRTENYSGISGSILNPAKMGDNFSKWDVNLVGASTFFSNNYAFLENTSLINAYKEIDNIVFRADLENPLIYQHPLFADFEAHGKKLYAFFKNRVDGPGFGIRLKNNFFFGMFSSFRVEFSAINIPGIFGYYPYDLYPKNNTKNIKAFASSVLSWGEIGANIGYKSDFSGISYGINIKYIIPTEAAYFESEEPLDFTKIGGDSILVGKSSFEFGYTSLLEGNTTNIGPKGSGFAFDLGIEYMDDEPEDYIIKIGASILDIGMVKLNKEAYKHNIIVDSTFLFDKGQFDNATTVMDLIKTFTYQATGDSLASKTNNFTIGMPLAFSLQVDYKVLEHIYTNAIFIKGFNINKNGLRRADQLSVAARFESRWFTANIPVSLINWRKVNLGLSLRMGPVIIGSDDLGYLFKKKKQNSFDAFFAIKIPAFSLGKNKYYSTGKKKKKKALACPKF